MAAEEVTRTKLFVNTEWTAETCPATIDGVELTWGVNAFNDAFAAVDVAKELTTPVEINMTGDSLDGTKQVSFVGTNDSVATGPELNGETRYKTDADILFTGTGAMQMHRLFRATNEDVYSTVTIGEGTSLIVKDGSGDGQTLSDLNTLNVYGDFSTDFLRISESDGGTLNVYSGGKASIGYLSASGSAGADPGLTINVYGDGKAYGNAQLIFSLSVSNTDNAVDNAMVINVTDYGVMSIQRKGDSKANYFVVRGDQQLNLTNGKLEYATAGTLTVQGRGKFSMSGASTAEVSVMNVSDTASVVIDANSSLSVTESLTIAEGASFSIDFTNYDFTKVSGNQTILSAGAITGNVAVIGGDKVAEAGYSLVNNGTSVMITDTDITDLYVDPSLAGTEQGAVVMVGDKKKYFGINAFDAVQGAVDAVSSADINGKYTITLNSGDEVQTLTGSKDADPIWGGALLVEDFGGRDVTITGNGIIETSRHEGDYTNKSTFTVITSHVTIDKGVTYSNSGHLVTLDNGVLDLYGKITDNGTSLGAGFYVMGSGDINIYDGGQLDYHCSTGFNYCGDITVYGNKDADSFSDLAQLYLHEGGGKLSLGGNFEGRHGAGSLTVTDNGYALLQGLELGGSDRKTYTAHTGTLTLDNGKAEIIDAVVLGAKGYGGKAMGAGFVDMKNGSVLTAKSITVNDAVYTIPADAEAGTDEVTSTTASAFKQDGTSTVITDSITVNGTSTYTIDMTGFGGEGTDWSKIQVVLKADAITGNITVNNAPSGTSYTYVDAKVGETGRVIYAYDDAQLDKNTICVTSGSYAEGDLVWANDAGYIFGTTAFNDLQTALNKASANGKDVVTTIVIDGKVGTSNYGCSVTAGNAFITGNGTIQTQLFGRGAGAGSTDPHSLDSNITIDSGVTVEVMGGAGQFSAIGTNYEIYGTVKQGGSGTLYSYLNLRDISAEDSSYADKTYVTNIYEGGSLTVGGIRTRLDKSHYELNVKGGTFSLNSTAVPNDNKNFKGLHLNVTDGGVVNMKNADYSFLAGSGADATAQFTADNGTINAANTTITFNAGSYFSLSNGSTATVKGLVFNTTGNTIDATSKLTYTGAITVGEEGSFTVDFTGFEAAEDQLFALIVDGSASTGGITGKVDVKGLEQEGWKVVQGSSIYAYDATKVSTANLVVNADWADDGMAFGATVTVGDATYLWGINAFGNLNDAIAAGAGNDAITITNAGESAYSISGSLDASGFTSLTLGGAWGIANKTEVYGNIVLENGASITGANYTYWQDNASVTIVGNAFLKDKYLNATEELDVTIVLTGDTDAETSRIQCNGRFQGPVAVTVTADDVKNLTADTYKIADYSKYNSANYYNYTVDSALKKAGYAIQKTADGVFLTKGEIYDVTTVVYDPSLTAEKNTVEYAGKTYTLGQNAFSDITKAIATTIANYDAEKTTDLVLMDDWIGTTSLSFAYSINVNIIDGTGEGVLIETSKQNGAYTDRIFDFYNFMDGVQGPSQVTIGEGVTFSSNTSETAPGASDIATAFRMNTGVLNVNGTITHNNCSGNYFILEGSVYNTTVNVSETGKINMGCIIAKALNITGDGEGFAESSQVIFSTSGLCDVRNVLITEYGTMQQTGDSSYVIGKSGNSQFVLDDGKLIARDLQVGNTEITGTLEMIGDSELVVRDLNVVGEYGDVTIDHTAMVDYSRKITGDIAVDFSTFDATAMDESFVVIVDGRDASTGITGNIEYIGDSKLTLAGWTAVNDGKNVYIYDEVFYGTNVYVDSENEVWSEAANLTEDGQYVIGLNAFGSIDKAVAAGKNTVISLNVLGNGDYSAANISFAVENEVVVNADGAFKADSITAAGKAVTADQMDIVSGSGNVSRAGTLNLGDGKDDDAALTLADGETLILSQMNVTENATIYGDGVRFSGKGAALTIADGKTLTMSLEQLLAIQGVEIVGAEGSVIVTGLESITASQKAELIEEYGTIIKDLNEDTVAEADPITDVADLTEIDEGYVGDVGGTQGADKLVIGKGEDADYSGIDYNMRGGKNVATINADADFAIGDLTNVGTVDVKAGSKTGVTKATFGDITTSAGAGTVKVGNNAEFSADSIAASNLGGTNTVSFGNNVKGTVNGNVTELKSLALGNGSDLNVSGSISSDNTTFASAALKVGNDSTITAGDVVMSSVTLGKNVTADLGGIYTAKAVTIGANNTVSIDSVDGVAANGAIKAGNDSVVEIAADVNMRGGKNSIVTGKSSDWTIGSDVMNVNTLTVTAAGNWAWNVAKTAYTLQRTTLNIGGDFLAGEGAAVLNFGNYSIVEIGGGILESDLGSSFKITVGSNAEVAVGDMIQSLNSLTIGNGVDYKTYSLNEAGKAVADADKEEGTTVFSAGKVTGTAGNDTIKIGNKADVTMGKVSLGAGNDTINIGKDSTFEAADVALGAGKNTVVIGANSWMYVDDISGVNKLTATGNLIAGDITGTDDFADVVTFNGNAEIGSIDLGTDAKGKMSDKLVIGKGAEVVINGGISNVEALTIGAGAKVSASESTIAAMKELGSAKGSKIDASVEFVALDDAADNAAGSTTVYDGNAEAWLGLVDGDTTDIFTLGDGTDLTGWAIEGEGIKVNIYTTTGDGNWEMTPGGITADENGKFALGNYMPAADVTGVKVCVSLENSDDAALTKYNVTKLA